MMPLFHHTNGKAPDVSGKPGDLLNPEPKNIRTFGGKVRASMKHIFTYILFFIVFPVPAQFGQVLIDSLPEIHLSDWKVKFTEKDSVFIIQNPFNNSGRLTQTLFDQSDLVIREYGKGMISGISVRGSSPNQVQVLWNGIPLNSPLNGQTDLNTIAIVLFDKLSISKGGSSVFYGTGAMAGSLRLENPIEFKSNKTIKATYSGGQFGNHTASLNSKFSGKKHFLKAALFYQNDKNQYEVTEKKFKNTNAEIFHNSFLLDYAYRMRNSRFELHVFNSYVDRNLPPTLTTVSNSKLVNENSRIALHWNYQKNQFHWHVSMARLKENYRYYHHKDESFSGFGHALTYLGQLALQYTLESNLKLLSEWGTERIEGETGNFIAPVRKKSYLITGIVFKKNKNIVRAAVRKNFSTDYKFPFLYNLHITRIIFPSYRVSLSATTNYRLPTFNDLYWNPGGNPDLLPEQNTELEWTQIFSRKNFYVQADVFYKNTKNLIKWRPQNNGFWSPTNIGRVRAKGVEISVQNKFHFPGNIKMFTKTAWTYADVVDLSTGKQLIYTPKLSGFISQTIQYHFLTFNYSFRYQDHYYTDPQHHSVIYGHWLHNIGVDYRFKNWKWGVEIRNLFNQYYELMPSRPMPGREINWKIQYQINKNKQL